MNSTFKSIIICFVFISSNQIFSQTKQEQKKEEDEFAVKKTETKIFEVITLPDSADQKELNMRADIWLKKESNLYKKTNGSQSNNKTECTISFQIKPKIINPEIDYTGKISMKLVIECKVGRYKYTISDIKHTSKNGKATGGSIDNTVPECGTMHITEIEWKKIKGEALQNVKKVSDEIKPIMAYDTANNTGDEW
jgi:hypothetical protein